MLLEKAQEMLDELNEVMEDEQEYIDNMPENLQDSQKAETANEAVENLQEAICLLEEIADLDFDQEEFNEKIDAACN